ncbi:hypothetical protein F0U44_08415 [Nocardioides humilatus]|uniref:Sulfotransferase family protein n=1 Tax=Nocardioides humilatus TaxID=2607660 RepID=A0A5B1LCQ1_9ACTN|nr:hypothetical protein [Nocardioides humilatus]KAA1418523.1 hypothetical protein F0U44_08415 [Nocardioides humilatus]
MPPRVDTVLHIGTGKTGTTTIQRVLARSREVLAEGGTLYPRAFGRQRHLGFGFFVLPDPQLVRSPEWLRAGNADVDPDEFRRKVRRRLRRELTPDVRRLLISDEGLYRRNASTVARVRKFTEARGGATRVVIYLRRQDDHLVSNYQQVVKGGEIRRIGDWANSELDYVYDFHSHLARWRDNLGPATFVVRTFEPERFVGGSIVADFLDAAGVDVDESTLVPQERRNESLCAEAVEVLRLLNVHGVEQRGARAGLIINSDHVRRLHQVAGPVLTMPEADLDRFQSRWEASNQAIAREFLDRADGELFGSPRRREGMTTEQVLAPERLDHYLDLLEIPADDRPGIRAVAEREAGS